MWGNKPLFARVPGKANFACVGLLVLAGIALLTATAFAVMLYVERDNLHPVGGPIVAAILGCQIVLAVAGPTAAVLLSRRSRGARVIATIVAVLFLVNVAPAIFWLPEFIIGVFVLTSLWSPDMRRFIHGEAATAASTPHRVAERSPRTSPVSPVDAHATSPVGMIYGVLSILFSFNFFPAGLGFGLLGLARYRAALRSGAVPLSRSALVCSAIGTAMSTMTLLLFALMVVVVIMTEDAREVR